MTGRVKIVICIFMNDTKSNNTPYSRECPICKKLLFYSKKFIMISAIKHNATCKSCSHILHPRPHTEEMNHKQSEWAKKKFENYTPEQWQKMREDGHKYGLLQPPLTEEERLARCGKGNHFYGHTHTEETKRQLGDRTRGTKMPLEQRIKISETMIKNEVGVGDKNVAKRPEDRLRKRLARIEKLKSECGQVFPFYNKRGCDYFNNLNIERGWNIQHAMNGGEYYLNKLGYWLDGYDKDKNIVVEYDEKRHYKANGQLKEKDVRRMNEIINHLKCSFYRYDERNNRFYQVI